MTNNDFPHQIALITGPAGNLGSAVVAKFLLAGMKLILVDRAPNRLFEQYPALLSEGHFLIPGLDLASSSAADQLTKELESVGKIDYLVHTVGGFQMGEKVNAISAKNWDRMMRLNVHTFRHVIQPILPRMAEQGHGKIISIGARPALKGRARMGAYSASKAALLRLTESIAEEYAADNIQAHCIIPGTIDTPENRAAMPNANPAKWTAPDEIAEKIVKICLDDSPERDVIVPCY